MSTIAKIYLSEVKKELGKITDIKRVFLSELKSDIQEYLFANKDADLNALYQEFGTPSTIAQYFYDETDINHLKKKAKKFIILKIIIAIFFMAFIILIVDSIKDLNRRKDFIIVDDNFNLATESEAQSDAF